MSEYTECWKSALNLEIIPGKKEILQRFFKTGKGEYGEGDIFLGITNPGTRKVSKLVYDASFKDISLMLESPIHEHRLSALLVLVDKYAKARKDLSKKKEVVDFYLSHTQRINNWDLVDLSAPKIVGKYVSETGHDEILYKLSQSENLWEQRIAIVSTWTLISNGNPTPTLIIAERMLTHRHDLIHKATGWMLREIGKKIGENLLLSFLDRHASSMPRTMLRYAIEKLDQPTRKYYMSL